MPNVVIDNTGQNTTALSSTTATIGSFVVGSGSDRAIFLGVSQWKAADLQPTVTFNGSENFTALGSITIVEGAGVRRVTLFRLLNPTVTTANIVVTWGVACDEIVVGAISVFNANSAVPSVVTNSGTAASSSINLAGAVGDINWDAISADASAGGSPAATANRTQRWGAVAAANTTEGDGQTSSGTGGSLAHTWSTLGLGASTVFAHAGIVIQQTTRSSHQWPVGTRQQPGNSGPFDPLGFLKAQSYSYVPTPPAASTFQPAWGTKRTYVILPGPKSQ